MEIRHILMAVFVAAVWGLNFVMVKKGLEVFPPFFFVGFRYFCACFPLIFFFKKPPVSNWIILGIGFSIGVAKFSLAFWGMHLGVSAGIASLLMQTQVFFTVLLAVLLLKSRVTLQQIVGMVIAFIGISLIGIEAHGSATFLGFCLLIGSALFWAISNIITKKAGKIDMFPLILWTSLVPPLPMFGLSLQFEGGDNIFSEVWSNLTWTALLCVLYTAWVATWLGATLWGRLLSLYSPAVVAPYSLLIPVFALLSSFLLLGESLSLPVILASGLILLGLLINQWPRQESSGKAS